MNEPIHIAITRRVKPGFEAEFQQALQEFLKTSFDRSGVQGASMLVPSQDSKVPEFGIMRTFANQQDSDAFYQSPMFKTWEDRIRPMIDGDPVYRRLNGLEAWFRGPHNPPPRWKMALLTWIAVWPVSMLVPAVLEPLIGRSLPHVIFAGAASAGIVLVLTWVAMPILVKLTRSWLQPKPQPTKIIP